jgi:hypothetical protein
MKKVVLVGGSLLAVVLIVLGSQTSGVGYRSVKASQEVECIDVTVGACGIEGFGNNTVRLTKQQYKDLETYLIGIRTRLNQMRAREEAIPILQEAVIELNEYGLLPKKMSIQKAQELVTERPSLSKWNRFLEKATRDNVTNIYCLTYINGIISNKLSIWTLTGILLNRWAGYHLSRIILFFSNCLLAWAVFKPLNVLCILEFDEAQLFTIGLLGIKHCENVSDLGVFGFVGLQITTNFKEAQITCLGWSYSTELIYTPD